MFIGVAAKIFWDILPQMMHFNTTGITMKNVHAYEVDANIFCTFRDHSENITGGGF